MHLASDETSLSADDKYIHLSFLRSICLENELLKYPRFSYINLLFNGKYSNKRLSLSLSPLVTKQSGEKSN